MEGEENTDRNATAYINGSGNICLIIFPNARDHQHAEKGSTTETESKRINHVEFDNVYCTWCRYNGIPIFRTSKGNENWFEKSAVKLQCSNYERETTFGSSYWEVQINEGVRNWDSTVCYRDVTCRSKSIFKNVVDKSIVLDIFR